MGGIAALACEAGHRVTGCDANVYPPMSTQLRALGIELIDGFGAEQLALKPDVFVIGNALSRGNPLVEAILQSGAAYTSGPQWLAEHVLAGRHVLAVAGTHGKTTTTSMLAWILQACGKEPGFLVGGVPQNFGVSARLGSLDSGSVFVVEADEYDTAFFDKRSKFVHYRPRTAILNNLEFDHADIFEDLAAIERQFHHLVRTVPGGGVGRIVVNSADSALARVLAAGCWSEVHGFTASIAPKSLTIKSIAHEPIDTISTPNINCQWSASGTPESFTVMQDGVAVGEVNWALLGVHNQLNALAAIAAAVHAGVEPRAACAALASFENVKRRLELRGTVKHKTVEVSVYDDFAHHPTAIATTLDGLRRKVGAEPIIAIFEPRSATMKQGAMAALLPEALAGADAVFCFTNGVGWDPVAVLKPLGDKVQVATSIEAIVLAVTVSTRNIKHKKMHVLIMSNGGFGGIHDKLLASLTSLPALADPSA
jgi:UDP-N-acetylmuramate: L-alanyl-gamma-D-glutamyl-meso-diaminopimelate ligase